MTVQFGKITLRFVFRVLITDLFSEYAEYRDRSKGQEDEKQQEDQIVFFHSSSKT